MEGEGTSSSLPVEKIAEAVSKAVTLVLTKRKRTPSDVNSDDEFVSSMPCTFILRTGSVSEKEGRLAIR